MFFQFKAVRHNRTDVVQTFIKAGVDPNIMNKKNKTALLIGIRTIFFFEILIYLFLSDEKIKYFYCKAFY